MKKAVFFFFGMLLLSCGEKVVEKPENLIPKEKMVDILHDLSLLNATKAAFGSKFKESGIDVMDFLYEKYEIDSVQFVESDLYYASIPLEYQSIYEKVEERIDNRKNIMENISKQKNDSIKKVQLRRRDSIKAKREENKPTEP
jgi:hypothetical protein